MVIGDILPFWKKGQADLLAIAAATASELDSMLTRHSGAGSKYILADLAHCSED